MNRKTVFTRREFLGLSAISLIGGCAHLTIPSVRITSETFRIAFVSDLHLIHAPFIDDSLEKIRTRIKAAKADIVIGGGDWVHLGSNMTDDEARPLMKKARALFDSLDQPRVIIPGNWDYVDIKRNEPKQMLSVYYEAFGKRDLNQVIDLGAYALFVIESIQYRQGLEYPYVGDVSKRTLEWLNLQLSRIDRSKPKILLLHIPLFTLLFQNIDGATTSVLPNKVVRNNREVLEAFKDRNLALTLQGHLHVNEYLKWNDSVFITGGALCGRWWTGANYGTEPGFGVVTLREGRIEWQYVPYGFDSRATE